MISASVLIVLLTITVCATATNINQLRVALDVETLNCLPDPVNSCSGHGVCINNGTVGFYCKCDNNYNSKGCAEGVQCCNELQSRVTIFVTALLIGWTGTPYFLIGAVGLGVGILLTCVGGCCFAGFGIIMENKTVLVLGIILLITCVTWDLATLIMASASTEVFDGEKVGSW